MVNISGVFNYLFRQGKASIIFFVFVATLNSSISFAEEEGYYKTYEVLDMNGTCKLTILTAIPPGEDFKWSSDKCVNGKAAGMGWVEWSDDIKWKGSFENGFRKYGRFTAPWGWCEGNYKEALEGEATCFHSDAGVTYKGDYHMGVRSGIGTETGNGDYFKGHWAHDLKNGPGEMRWKDGDRYVGNYKNGLYDGKGKYFYSNGNIYEGDYKEDNMDGKGRMTYPNGDWYEGEYRNDQKNGQGVFYWVEYDERFVGLFRDGNIVKAKGKYLKGDGVNKSNKK
ncbi:hypothetical protein CHL16_22170 [Salmonella enterica]|nr:hypothetical protein [Salmonella enterica]